MKKEGKSREEGKKEREREKGTHYIVMAAVMCYAY